MILCVFIWPLSCIGMVRNMVWCMSEVVVMGIDMCMAGSIDVYIHIHTYIHMGVLVYRYICVFVCIYVDTSRYTLACVLDSDLDLPQVYSKKCDSAVHRECGCIYVRASNRNGKIHVRLWLGLLICVCLFLCTAIIDVCIVFLQWPCDETHCCIAALHCQCNVYGAACVLKHKKKSKSESLEIAKNRHRKKVFLKRGGDEKCCILGEILCHVFCNTKRTPHRRWAKI